MATLTFYNNFLTKQLNGNAIDLDTDTIKISAHTSSYTPNRDSDDFWDDATNEVSSGGYTAGGATLASKTVTQDDPNDRATFDAADVTWNNVTFTVRYLVIYKSTGTAATSPLIAYVDLGSNLVVSAADLNILWSSSGIFWARQGS